MKNIDKSTKDRILSETPVSVKEKVREMANDLVGEKERMYSEEEVKHIVSEALQSALVKVDLEQWFKQFSKLKRNK